MFIPLLLTTITALATINLHGMESNQIANYETQCKIIQKTLKNEKNDFLEMIDSNRLDPAQELTRIKQQFDFYKEKSEKEKNNSLLLLKKCHNISDDDWQWCMETTKNISVTAKDTINNKLPNAVHDPILSGENKMILAHYLHKYGLNIQKINITTGNRGSFTYCTLRIPKEHPNEISVDDPRIGFDNSQEPTKGLVIPTAWSFAHNSCVNSGFIYAILKKSNKNYTPDTLIQSHEYMRFSNIQRKQAEIFPSLEDYEACKAITKTRSQHDNIKPSCEHFQQLCTIKNLWEKLKIVEELLQK